MILDPVGARYAGLNLELLRRDGRWVIIGLMGGREAQLDLAQLLRQTHPVDRLDPAYP